MRKPTAPTDHIVTANRGWKSEPMTKSSARRRANTLKRLGNVNVKVRKIG